MSSGTRSHRRHLRSRAITLDSDDDSCIDLTEADEVYVDLTSSQHETGVNDSSVVVIGSSSDSPVERRRGQRLPPPDAFDDDDSLIELPPAPFNLTTPIRPSRSRNPPDLQSPEPIKITCPVCLDDDKTIRKEKKQFASTTCGHVFCKECIVNCVKAQHCCPVCRKRLHLKEIRPLHI